MGIASDTVFRSEVDALTARWSRPRAKTAFSRGQAKAPAAAESRSGAGNIWESMVAGTS
jgi:hypothetical protein